MSRRTHDRQALHMGTLPARLVGTPDLQTQLEELWNRITAIVPPEATPETPGVTVTLDAILLRQQASSFIADAIKKSSRSGSFLADAIARAVASGSFPLDAVLGTGGQYSALLDAVLKAERSGSLSLDALLQLVAAGTFTGDAVIRRSLAGSATGDAVLQATRSASRSLDAVLFKSISGSAAIDGILKKTLASSFTGDALLKKIGTGSALLDAVIRALSITFTIDSKVQKTYTLRPTSDVETGGTVTYSTGTSAWPLIDEAVLDTSDWVRCFTVSTYWVVGITSPGIPSTATIKSVQIDWKGSNGAPANQGSIVVRDPSTGTRYDVATILQSATTLTYGPTTTRPWGGSYTYADANALQFGVRGPTSGTLNKVQTNQMWATVIAY